MNQIETKPTTTCERCGLPARTYDSQSYFFGTVPLSLCCGARVTQDCATPSCTERATLPALYCKTHLALQKQHQPEEAM